MPVGILAAVGQAHLHPEVHYSSRSIPGRAVPGLGWARSGPNLASGPGPGQAGRGPGRIQEVPVPSRASPGPGQAGQSPGQAAKKS